MRRCRPDIGFGQIRIDIKIQPWRPVLDPAQDQMFDGVIADSA